MPETTTARSVRSTRKPPHTTREQRRAITDLHTRIYVTERKSRGLGSPKISMALKCGPAPCSFKRTCENHQALFESQRPAERKATEDYKLGIIEIKRGSSSSDSSARVTEKPRPALKVIRPTVWRDKKRVEQGELIQIPYERLMNTMEASLILVALKAGSGRLAFAAHSLGLEIATLGAMLRSRHPQLLAEIAT